jgi:hypothetical protein
VTESETHLCRLCGRELEIEATFSREGVCPCCGGYLHCCRNCHFFAGDISRGCKEPQAQEVRNKEGANFCDFFRFGEGSPSSAWKDEASKNEAARARSQFESLFRKGPDKEQLSR